MPVDVTPDAYAVIGHPVAHSASPAIHRLFAQQFNEPIVYTYIDVDADRFSAAVAEFFAAGGQGLNVTAPHKIAAHDLADALSMHARVAGAVNTLAMKPDGDLAGDNTDGTGLVRDLQQNLGIVLAGSRIAVVGAGGAARGVLAALLGTGPAQLLLANRDEAKARELATRFAGFGPIEAVSLAGLGQQSFDVVINATSAGLSGRAPELPGSLPTGALCYDMSYGNEPTPFLTWAAAHNARSTTLGWGMLVEQAAESFYIWRGVRPDTQPVLENLISGL